MTDASGVYKLKYIAPHQGAIIAEHVVRITVVPGTAADGDRVPAKYHEKSELKATVEAGDNVIDFDLESK